MALHSPLHHSEVHCKLEGRIVYFRAGYCCHPWKDLGTLYSTMLYITLHWSAEHSIGILVYINCFVCCWFVCFVCPNFDCHDSVAPSLLTTMNYLCEVCDKAFPNSCHLKTYVPSYSGKNLLKADFVKSFFSPPGIFQIKNTPTVPFMTNISLHPYTYRDT